MSVEEPEIEIRHPDPAPDYGKGLAWTMGFNALMKVTVGAVGIYIARKLDLSIMGAFGLLANIYVFAEQMREAGLKQAFYNDNDISPIRFRTYARLSVMSGMTFGILLSLLSIPLSIFFSVPALARAVVWAAFATFTNGLSVIPMAALYKSGRFRDAGLIESASNLSAAAVSLTMVLRGWGLEALVAQLVIRATVQFALSFAIKPFSIFNHDRQAARSIMRVCTPLVTTDLLWLFYSLADQFAIVKILGAKINPEFAKISNGLYQQGRKLISIPNDLVFTPLLRTVAVAIGNRSNDAEHLARTFMKAISLSALMLASMFGACAALARPLVLALYTEKYEGTIPILGIICLGEAFKMTGTFAGSALVAAGKSKIPMVAWLLPYVVASMGILITWNHISLMAIAWSYTAGMIAVNVVVMAAGFKYLKVERRQLTRFWECVGITSSTTLVAYGLSFAPLKPWPMVFVALLTLPVIHALLIGTVFARNPLAYLSLSGVRKLRESL